MRRRHALPSLITVVIAVVITGLLPACNDSHAGVPVASIPGPSDLTPDELVNVEVFERVSPSVVNVEAWVQGQNFRSRTTMEVPQNSGSGFVWDDQGHIVTNFHVIKGADGADVTLADGTTVAAELVGAYADKDLAVLKIEPPPGGLHPITIGRSDHLRVGQKVLAIGNPFGLDHTLSVGVVSALDREIATFNDRTIQGVIQTDAAINKGNSGGPLLDSSGLLIGVNTQIVSDTGGSVGIGFAIPVDEVSRTVPELIEHGEIRRPQLGLRLHGGYSQKYGLKGLLIWTVEEGSGAHRAGLRPGFRQAADGSVLLGDVLLGIDSKPIRTLNDLFHQVEDHEIGDVVELTIRRGDMIKNRRFLEHGEIITVSVTLQAPSTH